MSHFKTTGIYRLYLLVSDTLLLQQFLDIGVKHLQLRIKNKPLAHVEEEIKKALILAQQYDAQIVINDYADLALKHNAPFLHIGQEDLENLTPQTYQKLFKKPCTTQCGFSTHSYDEFEKISHLPSCYVALGPIFHTTTKDVGFPPCGTDLIPTWKEKLNALKKLSDPQKSSPSNTQDTTSSLERAPSHQTNFDNDSSSYAGLKSLVTIGGITLEKAPEVFAKGADIIAVSGDILGHPKPFERARAWLEITNTIDINKND